MTDKSSILMKYAINYLSKYSSSKSNLKRILEGKIRRLKIEKKEKFLLYNSIESILEKLERNNYLNDLNYIDSKINSFLYQGKSKIFMKNYFQQKGQEREIIDKSFERLDGENENWETESAKIFAKKKRFKNSTNQEKNLSKFARAGFSYEISKKILEDI